MEMAGLPKTVNNEDLQEAACEVLDRMYFAALVPAEEAMPVPQGDAGICVAVGFRGSLSGTLLLRVSRGAAIQLREDFSAGAGTNDPELALRDALGELGNMICGSFLSNIDAHGEYRIARPLHLAPQEFDSFAAELHCAIGVNDGLLEAHLSWCLLP